MPTRQKRKAKSKPGPAQETTVTQPEPQEGVSQAPAPQAEPDPPPPELPAEAQVESEQRDEQGLFEAEGLPEKKKKLLTALTQEQEEEMVEWLSENCQLHHGTILLSILFEGWWSTAAEPGSPAYLYRSGSKALHKRSISAASALRS